jgi:hypothetical protein
MASEFESPRLSPTNQADSGGAATGQAGYWHCHGNSWPLAPPLPALELQHQARKAGEKLRKLVGP